MQFSVLQGHSFSMGLWILILSRGYDQCILNLTNKKWGVIKCSVTKEKGGLDCKVNIVDREDYIWSLSKFLCGNIYSCRITLVCSWIKTFRFPFDRKPFILSNIFSAKISLDWTAKERIDDNQRTRVKQLRPNRQRIYCFGSNCGNVRQLNRKINKDSEPLLH